MEEQYLLFEKFLSNELSEEERISFTEQLSSNISFKENFLLYKETHTFLTTSIEKEEETSSFKENLSNISDSYFNKRLSSKKSRVYSFMKYAAALFLLIFGVYMYQNSFKPINYEDFVSYSSIDITVRSTQNELLTKAERAFNNKDFENASKNLETLIKQDESNTELKLYHGFCLIELNIFEKADQILNTISSGNSVYKNQALWYLALSKLKQKEYTSSKNILLRIDKDSPEYNLAKPLLSKLK